MTTHLIWSASDAATINDFLKTPVGVKWIGVLMSSKPKVDINKGTEVAALAGAFAAGYEYLLYEVIPTTRAVRSEQSADRPPINMVPD